MRSVARTRLMALVMAVAMAGFGCVHTQQPERTVYVISEDASGVTSEAGNAEGGAGAEAYCNEIQKQCFAKCWRRKPEISHIKKGSAEHNEQCTSKCLKAFMDCTKEQEELERQESGARKRELHFTNMSTALGWLREHKTEAAIGTIVIVGGVVTIPYAIIIPGGALVLAPL